MKATTTRAASRGYVDRLIVGTPAEVANVLRNTGERGLLLAATVPHRVPGDASRVAVKARMVAPATARTTARVSIAGPSRSAHYRITRPSRSVRRRAGRRAGMVAAVAAGAVVALAALLYAAILLITAVWPLLLAAAVVLFLLRRVQVRAGVCCPGLHCPGCRH